jgi:hypothetical protein
MLSKHATVACFKLLSHDLSGKSEKKFENMVSSQLFEPGNFRIQNGSASDSAAMFGMFMFILRHNVMCPCSC